MPRERDKSIDIVKGIVIILMVAGHAGCPSYFANIICSFHMPCFFIISGMLLNDYYFNHKKNFILKRIKGLYVPFVKWSLIFLVFHNFFVKVHLYSDTYHYNIHDFEFKVFQIFTMTGTEQLLGGFWFLKELLYANIIGLICLFCGKRHHPRSTLFFACILVILAYFQSICPYKIPTISSKTLLATSYYVFGFFLSTHFNRIIWKSNFIYIILFALFVIPFPFRSLNSIGTDIFFFFIFSIVRCIFVIMISQKIVKFEYVTNLLCKIGQSTLYILIFHFISFKIISFLLIILGNHSINELKSFPTILPHSIIVWLLYTFAGIAFPYMIWTIKNRLNYQNN